MRGRTKGRAPRRRRARDARRDAPRRVSARGEGRERPVAFGDARTERGGSRGRARVPAAVAASRMGFVPWLFVYANPKAKPPPRHALASALWLRTRMFPTVIVEGGGVVPAFGRPRGGRPRSGARARAGGLAGGAANGQRKKARGPSWKKGAPGSATTPERARSLGKEPETGRRDPAIRARSERGGGRRRRRRGRALPRLSRLRRGARPWVWRRARRDRRKRRELADGRSLSRHARRSFVPGRICDRGLEISRTTGRAVLIGGGWGRGANAFHRTPIKTTRADRSNRTNHQTLPRHRHQEGSPPKVWDTRHH